MHERILQAEYAEYIQRCRENQWLPKGIRLESKFNRFVLLECRRKPPRTHATTTHKLDSRF